MRMRGLLHWSEDRVTPTPNIQIYLVFKETRVVTSNVSVENARRVACQSRRESQQSVVWPDVSKGSGRGL